MITADFTIQEDADRDAMIGRVVATDADNLNRIQYTGGNDIFTVNPLNGSIVRRNFLAELDFETK